MRLVPLKNLTPGDRLGDGVYERNGTLLLADGMPLTESHLLALRQRGVATLYIQDDRTRDVRPKLPISATTRRQVKRNLRQTFETLAERLRPMGGLTLGAKINPNDPALRQAIRTEVRSTLGPDGVNQIVSDVDRLLDDLMDDTLVSGLGNLREHDAYTYEHSVDVTIVGLLLARRAGWEGRRLRLFGLGLLLHDIGKLFVEPELLNKEAGLTDEEFDRIKRHPELGYLLLRELVPAMGPLPTQVAYQHHERQDGKGYPRGLKGSNRLGRNEANMIHDFGSVAAVADVYDALVSDRAYRPGYPVDHAVRLITGLAGTHLNRRAVDVFRKVVAPFPVCTEVVVQTGPYTGFRGIVTAVDNKRLDRPRIRLLCTPQEKDIPPIDLDLAQDPALMIASATAPPNDAAGDEGAPGAAASPAA